MMKREGLSRVDILSNYVGGIQKDHFKMSISGAENDQPSGLTLHFFDVFDNFKTKILLKKIHPCHRAAATLALQMALT